MRRRFRQVDVFGQGCATGNPVAVILDAEGLDDDMLRRVSTWSNLSECTFVLPPTDRRADYRVRIFSLTSELSFAGHPTLGTARAWLDAGGVPAEAGVVVQECGTGLVPVRISGDMLAFEAPPRIRSGPVDPATVTSLVEILRIDAAQVIDTEWLDNGPGWTGLLLDHADTVLALRPDVSAHPGRWDIGVIAPHDAQSETRFEVRAFFTDGTSPLREDPVTGSLNAAAAQWLTATGRATLPYVASQGTVMGRRGRVHLRGDKTQIWVGGHANVVLTGEALLPDHYR